jgi:hypothetical protein
VLRQLWRLTRPVPAAGPDALAVAIYDHPDGTRHAEESGYEGVACVDDAARLLEVLCRVSARTRLDWVDRWARGLLEFVLWMQEPDGDWVNFIHTWDGEKNRDGITSKPGQNFWLARAILGTQQAAFTVDDGAGAPAMDASRRGLAVAAAAPAEPDVRALHLQAALFADDAEPFLIERWAEELLACRDGALLKNAAAEVGTPHLWAHVHEGVLAAAGDRLGRRDYVDAAVASAEQVIVPAVATAFEEQTSTSPYDVASCVYSLDQLGAATGDDRWRALAADARAWFDGRNAAGRPVYDRQRGWVADGVDDDRVSENSGAEANVVAAGALLDEVVTTALAMPDPFAS